jgi:Flp pilus assembly CpaE family ATPase
VAGERILLVDDDRVIQAMVGGFLRRSGYMVRIASDGVEALGLISELLPDLVITDIRMPELNGIELTSRLRGHFRTARLPILMFSELTDVDDALEGYSAGADEYLPKPFELAILEAKIRALLRRAVPDPARAPRGKVVVFAHAKGGVGTTALAVNVAAILSETAPGLIGLLDLDVEFGNAAAQLNLKPRYTLADLRVTSGDVVDAKMFDRFVTEGHHVRLVAAADTPQRAALVTLPAVQLAIDQLSQLCDYVIVDAPASLNERTLTSIHACDALCVVTSASRPALRATKDCLEMLERMRLPSGPIRLILNNATAHSMDAESAGVVLGRRPDFAILRSKNLDVAINSGRPLVTSHPADPMVAGMRTVARAIVADFPAQAANARAPHAA